MKRFFRVAFPITIIAALGSCDQEVKINDEWEDTTVVYGLLNPNANTNWVRIERGYLGTEPASASFNQPDSLYYDTLHVTLYGVNEMGDTVDTDTLVKDQSRNLDTGTFTTENFRLYRTDQNLAEDLTYHLRIQKPGTNFEDTRVQTQLIEGPPGFSFIQPADFTTVVPRYRGLIKWRTSDRAELYEIDIFFHYKELDTTTGQLSFKSFKIDYESRSGEFDDQLDVTSNNDEDQIYSAIAGNVEANPNVLRFYEKMRIIIWAGGPELRRYTQLNEPSSGINQVKPEFTQVENGTGLLSSRTRIVLDDILLGQGANGLENTHFLEPQICDLNFAIASGADTCYCEFLGQDTERECF